MTSLYFVYTAVPVNVQRLYKSWIFAQNTTKQASKSVLSVLCVFEMFILTYLHQNSCKVCLLKLFSFLFLLEIPEEIFCTWPGKIDVLWKTNGEFWGKKAVGKKERKEERKEEGKEGEKEEDGRRREGGEKW